MGAVPCRSFGRSLRHTARACPFHGPTSSKVVDPSAVAVSAVTVPPRWLMDLMVSTAIAKSAGIAMSEVVGADPFRQPDW